MFEFANPVLQIDRHAAGGRLGGRDGVRFMNLRLQQLRHFLNLPAGAVTRVDHESFAVDLAQANEFLNRAKRGRSVITLGCYFHQPIHSQLREHRRFRPGLLVARNDIMRRDACRRCPARQLFKFQRAENIAVLVFPQKPLLVGRRFHHSLDVEAGVPVALAVGGIMIVWPACSRKGLSM